MAEPADTDPTLWGRAAREASSSPPPTRHGQGLPTHPTPGRPARAVGERGDLPEQWAIPLHAMPEAMRDITRTQTQLQVTLTSIADFVKCVLPHSSCCCCCAPLDRHLTAALHGVERRTQSAAVVKLETALAETVAAGEQERAAMQATIEQLQLELNTTRAAMTKTPSVADLEQRVRERCAKEVAREVAKSHRAMLSTAQIEVAKLAEAQLQARTDVDQRIEELRQAIATKADAEAVATVREEAGAREAGAAAAAEGAAEERRELRAEVGRVREQLLAALGRVADSETVAQELEQLRAAFANETRQLLTGEQVEALLLQKAESDAESLQGALHRKADVAALEYALEDKLDCADAEAILAEVAALKQELGRIEMTAVTSAQSAELAAASLGSALGLEQVGGMWSMGQTDGSLPSTPGARRLGSPAARGALSPGGGGGEGVEGLWTWTASTSTRRKGGGGGYKGRSVFLSGGAEDLSWERDRSRITVGSAGLYQIAFGFFPKRLPASTAASSGSPTTRDAWLQTPGSAAVAGGSGGQALVQIDVDGDQAMDLHHFSTHTSPVSLHPRLSCQRQS